MGLGEKKEKVGTYPLRPGTYPLLENNFLYQKELRDEKKWVRDSGGMKGNLREKRRKLWKGKSN
jgi:hypothetical protein